MLSLVWPVIAGTVSEVGLAPPSNKRQEGFTRPPPERGFQNAVCHNCQVLTVMEDKCPMEVCHKDESAQC